MRRGGQSESDLAIRRWLLSGRRGEKLHGKRLEIATKPVQSRFSFDGLNRGGYFEIYIYIFLSEKVEVGPWTSLSLTNSRRIGHDWGGSVEKLCA